jgi:hypothetical protein
MLYLEEPLFVSSTERPNKKPDLTKKPVTPHKEKVNFFFNFKFYADFPKLFKFNVSRVQSIAFIIQDSRKKETIPEDPILPIDENRVDTGMVPHAVTPETSTKFIVPSSTIRSKVNEMDNEDDNKLSNEVSIMGQKQVTPASFFARPGILAGIQI